jgi:lysophospholipase L1-like esterase
LLWRLENGELPQTLQPKVFWVLIGTNDLGNKWCSPDATVLGIVRVVEAIRHSRPGAVVVINSIFPRSWHKEGIVLKGKRIGKGNFLPELWTSISNINAHLKDYSEKRENVEFFDVNDVFFLHGKIESKKHLQIDKNLMHDYLHPSHVGYKLWGDQIVQKLDVLIG